MAVELKSTKLIPDSIVLKPARQVRYHKGITDEAVFAAARLSIYSNETRYVEPTAYGWAISNSKPSFTQYFEVNGREVKYYAPTRC